MKPGLVELSRNPFPECPAQFMPQLQGFKTTTTQTCQIDWLHSAKA
jgi:hypothetical protein